MKLIKLFLITFVAFAVSCGDSTRNDNGVSFTFFGWFQDDAGDVGATSGTLPLDGSGINSNNVQLFGGLQNNLTGQFIRIERAFHSYTVPGSSIRIPDTSVGVASFVRPPVVGTGDAVQSGTTLPTNAFTDAGAAYAGTSLVPPSIGQYISLNRSQLPELPFQMIITTYYEGVTSGGRRIQSNPIQLEIVVVSDLDLGGGAVDEGAPVDEVPVEDLP